MKPSILMAYAVGMAGVAYVVVRRSVVERLDFVFVLAGQSNMAGRGPLSELAAAAAAATAAAAAAAAAATGADPTSSANTAATTGAAALARTEPGGDAGVDARILSLDAAHRWVPAREPLHWDKPGPRQGVGPGLPFARAIARAFPGARIGLVPCAFGGSELARWTPAGPGESGGGDGDLLRRALVRIRAALQNSHSGGGGGGGGSGGSGGRKPPRVGILWHQGESDCGASELAATVQPRLRAALLAMRGACAAAGGGGGGGPEEEAQQQRVPVLVAQLGDFIVDGQQGKPERFVHGAAVMRQLAEFNTAAAATAAAAAAAAADGNEQQPLLPDVLRVSASGLGHIGDHLHFDTAAQLELGRRYADVWLRWWRATGQAVA